IKTEISTFSNGLQTVGKPYWLTSKQKRENQLAGSVAVAFRTEKDRRLAISQRLYIAGVSCRVENL
ncbi:uncharacterized protein K452DRAFT_198849, partial [Aplosporella prunicola CBS 121167]